MKTASRLIRLCLIFATFTISLGAIFVVNANSSTIGYWRFEEGSPNAIASGSGTILDSSGSMDHGTPSGSPFYRSNVPVSVIPQSGAPNGLSMEFNSPDDKIVFASQFVFHQPGDATLEFWMKYPGGSHQAVFWTRSDCSDTNRFHIYVNSDQTIGVDYRDPIGDVHPIIGNGLGYDAVPILPNTWTHIALTRSGNTYSLYRDGVLMRTQIDGSPMLPTSNGWTLSGRCEYEFVGSVDEVRISDVALVPGQFLNFTMPELSISIDIKPGSFPNSVNPNSKGKLPVAILNTGIFDATTVNPTTVLFGATGNGAAPVHSALEDLDGDGDTDMILHFKTQDTVIVCGDTSATLTGETFSGQAIEGSDFINTVGCE